MHSLIRTRSKTFQISATLAVCLLAAVRADASQEAYERTVRSTVVVLSVREGNKVSIGSGVVVSLEQGIAVTAAHVVGDAQHVAILFPEYDGDRVITDAAHYFKNMATLKVDGDVIKSDPRRDVAVIRLKSLSTRAVALPLASASAREGQSLIVVGHSSVGLGGLFGYSEGPVRNVYLRPDGVRVVDTAIPTNKGDSGGPVVNAQGELVAIVSNGTTGSGTDSQQLRDNSIDVTEIRDMMQSLNIATSSGSPSGSSVVAAPIGNPPLWSSLFQVPPAPAPATPPTPVAPVTRINPVNPVSPFAPVTPVAPSPFVPGSFDLNPDRPSPWTTQRPASQSLAGGVWVFTESCKEHGSHTCVQEFHNDGTISVVKYAQNGEVLQRSQGTYGHVGSALVVMIDGKTALSATVTWNDANSLTVQSDKGREMKWLRETRAGGPVASIAPAPPSVN